MTEPVTTGVTDNQEVGTPDNMEDERNPSSAGQPKAVSRREKRKALKKDKRKQIRKELAAKARTEEEARLNDPEEKRKIELEEEREKERLEKERKEFEERERIFIEELQKKKEEEEEEERRNAVERELKLKEEGTNEGSNEDDEWEYIEEGPPEIIWQGNEIIVKKNKVRVKKKDTTQSIEKEDLDRPTSNPLPPQSEAYAAFKNTPMGSTELLDTVAQQVPNFGTEQDKAHCPFHIKTGACRFGMRCNRVHYYPDKSTTLLIKNMYNGPGLAWEQDEGLEYSEEEVERSYEEFYEDVHTEFLKFGEIINFKVCRNGSFHLRGNVYIQYMSLDSAVMAYNSVHGRYFAARQVKCEYVSLTRWKVAICGEYMKSRLKTCSRGSACNFLHCFTNPGGDYEWADCDKPPPRFWVKKMVALFGYSDDKHIDQQTPKDHNRIFTSDKDSYHSKRHRSIEKNQHNGSSSKGHHDENHVRKKRRTKYENLKDSDSDSDSDGRRFEKKTSRRHREGSQNHSRYRSESKPRDYNRKSKRRTHSSSSDEDYYTKKRHFDTKSRSRHKRNVSDSSTDEESDDVELKKYKERIPRRRGGGGDGGSGEVERRWKGRSRSRGGSEKNEMSDRWEPDELNSLEGDDKSSHVENRKSHDRDDKVREKRKRI